MSSLLRCIVVEDEPLAAKVLTDYIRQTPFLALQGTFKDALLALDFLRESTTDLIFLDLHLPKLKGFDFLKTLSAPPAVIVTSAYHQYALEGFNLNVVDYLLKPFEFERFLTAVNKVLSGSSAKNPVAEPPEKDYLFLTVQKKRVRIRFSEIVYVESQKEYVKIVTTERTFLSKISTHEVEALLPSDQFIRVHRSFIVSLSKIEAYSAESVELSGISLPIGRSYKAVLDKLF